MIHAAGAPDISLTPVEDFAAVGARWRALEAAATGGYFRSWAFIGAQITRFRAPHLLAVRVQGQDAALAVLNRRQGLLYLGETGDPREDAVFVEHNGMLVRPGAEALLGPALAQACRAAPLVLSGVDDGHADAAREAGYVVVEAERFAPQVALGAIAGDFIDTLSANARAQIRRALRLYDAPPELDAAPDVATALAWFGALAELHQQRWTARGKPGAFADPALRAFHETLIRGGLPQGAVDVLRIAAGGAVIGYLYNFRHGGHVMNYQSGFAPDEETHAKPGLVCHALAIAHYRARGERVYDLLAGAQRYKTTLSRGAGQTLHWLTLYGARTVRGRLRVAARALRTRIRTT